VFVCDVTVQTIVLFLFTFGLADILISILGVLSDKDGENRKLNYI